MELTAILISVLALGLSGFTFWWTSIREVRKLYLVRIDRLASMMTPEFALVNGGSKEILITTIECGFYDKDKNGCAYPAQRIQINEGDSLLLSAGKAFHCRVTFLEPFTSSFALGGERYTKAVPPIYLRDMCIDIAWIEQSGASHRASAVLSRYGFSEAGHICMHMPITSKHDLHKARKIKSGTDLFSSRLY